MKISKYNDFLTESLNIFINEALVLYTSHFKDMLIELSESEDESVSKVAYFLSNMNNRDIDKLVQNYIGISKENDKVTFIPSNKIDINYLMVLRPSRIICYYNIEILNLVGINSLENIVHSLNYVTMFSGNRDTYNCQYYASDDKLDLKSIEIKNSWTKLNQFTNIPGFDSYTFFLLQNIEHPELRTLLYCPEYELINEPVYGAKYNIPDIKPSDIKIGRFVNKLIELYFKTKTEFKSSTHQINTKKDFTASDVEKFVNAYTSRIIYENNIGKQFDIVSGEDIKYWYNIDNYESKNGQLGSSCMRYYTCQGFFKIYVENPEVCKLLILKSFNNKLIGRALLWVANDGNTYIDRIYTIKDNYNNIFSRYAEENGYRNVYDTSGEIKVQVKSGNYNEYPYMDSLRWYLPEIGILTNKRPEPNEKPYFLLQETDGEYNKYL